MPINLDLQICTESQVVPTLSEFQQWVDTLNLESEKEVTIRIVDGDEMTELNQTYRGKSGPTNVLSFEFDPPPGIDTPLLGDIVICAPVVIHEATEQSKAPQLHWAHLTVHGMLHLLGYDHETDDEADVMEQKEIQLLGSLGFKNPYANQDESNLDHNDHP